MLHIPGLARNHEVPRQEAVQQEMQPKKPFSRVLSSELPDGTDLERFFDLVLSAKTGDSADPPMKFGIAQATLREYDPTGTIAGSVKELNEEKARKIYTRIWERAGCDLLSDPINLIHFESFLQHPKKAMEFLAQSRGDVQAYLRLRDREGGAGPGLRTADAVAEKLPALTGAQREIYYSRPPASFDQLNSAGKIASYRNSSDRDFDTAVAFVIQQEGTSLISNDNGHGPSRFGILQTTLRQLDPRGRIARSVVQLDKKKAREVYRRIWKDSGCDKLPYPINILHFDTTVHRPKTALKALRASGGDPEAYLRARQASLRALKSYPRYARNWEERMKSLADLVKG